MKTSDFYYDLPEKLIAQEPLLNRDSSRLLVINKDDGEIEHKHFKDIIDYLSSGDVLVVNNSRVMPARLIGRKDNSTSKVEILLLKNIGNKKWETLVRPGKKLRCGAKVIFGEGELTAEILEVLEDGNRIVKFNFEGIFEEVLDRLGEMPLPPYIKKTLDDKERYQTVYSNEVGSAAAPTAGLHFTKELLEKIKEKGVKIANVTLHVGLGTFRPISVEDTKDHKMHSEYYILDKENEEIINKAKENGGRIIAVGTTSVRTLESIFEKNGKIKEDSGETDIFIYPGFDFKVVDAMITNFHLPESTLMMLISAFSSREMILNAYNIAVKENYRFFSFGDASLIYSKKNCKPKGENNV